ncbi:MAG: SxtJ family membrane protein [Candidatus Omnitrophota bacterium]
MIKPNLDLSAKDLRKFGCLMAGVIALLSLIAVWREHWMTAYFLWTIAGVVFLLPALVFPENLRTVYKYWMKFALFLGWLNSRIILFLIFFFMFIPISVIQRIIGRDPMHRIFEPEAKSYWIDRSQEKYNPKHFERQF